MSSEARLEAAQSNDEELVGLRIKPVSIEPLEGEHPRSSSSSDQDTFARNENQRDDATLEMSVRQALLQMIRRLSPNPTLRQDLLQEALIHLWRTEIRRPGQTRSWYIQSCRFHLHHYLNSGRSIDSTKRWRDQLPLTDGPEDSVANEQADSGDSIFTCVNAREILSLLGPHLTTQEQAVLVCLAEGLGAREIGRKLSLSHTMAIRHRRKIASVLKKLELHRPERIEVIRKNGACDHNGHSKRSQKTD